MEYYPVAVNIADKQAVVVGAGYVAQRKVISLLEAGARVKIIAPDATPFLEKLNKQGEITWVSRRLKRQDLHGAQIVIAATSDKKVNASVSRWAEALKILVNVVDEPVLSTFISPAVMRQKRALIAVYTNGREPALARDLKNYLRRNWDDFLSYRDSL